jgi:ubiquinone/menaquinone biosynthesis C-methylase UbiE
LFTRPFALERSFYAGRSILDVGCGPRGSLEWADDARERVGVDPLARRYRALGTDGHEMRYVAARAEALPFEDGRFDVVSAFNCLDHVEDAGQAAAELARVLSPHGVLLLIVEIGHEPSVTEPLTLSWELTNLFAPALAPELERRLEKLGGINDSVLQDPVPFDASRPDRRPGVLVAKLGRAGQ